MAPDYRKAGLVFVLCVVLGGVESASVRETYNDTTGVPSRPHVTGNVRSSSRPYTGGKRNSSSGSPSRSSETAEPRAHLHSGGAPGEALDEDIESRTSGKIARFLSSSVKLVQGVLPGNIGKLVLPKVEDRSDDSVCYDNVGCFTNMDRLTVPSAFPVDPADVNTMFWLYSRSNANSPTVFGYRPNSAKIRRLGQFQRRKPLKLLVHGFTESGNIKWAQDMKNALLNKEDCNVIIVDWSEGAGKANYIRAAGNTALVGREISLLLQDLIKQYRGVLDPSNIHIIGFSLGAQVAGFSGRHFKKNTRGLLGRITALDAAGPLFDDVSLSAQDAAFIDAIHTSGGDKIINGQLGTEKPVGHVDFYPNGGKKQPGCLLIDLTCDHKRAPELYVESIKNDRCRFQSTQCQGGLTAVLESKCGRGGERGEMGYRARGRGIQFLRTRGKSQFCIRGQ